MFRPDPIIEDATKQAADDARNMLADDLLRSADAAVRASAGAMEEEADEFAIDMIDPSIAKYQGSGSQPWLSSPSPLGIGG